MNVAAAARTAALASRIPGWFTFEAAMLFAWIDEIQSNAGIRGDLFEIGVHHGKSAVMLGAMAKSGESLGVCDLFEQQGQNKSGSGRGQRDALERNFREVVGGEPPRVFAQSSSTLEPGAIGAKQRFFHIDGGHDADEALSDLRLAAATTIDRGVIVLDDPLKPEWPGVTEGLFRFLSTDDRFRAVVVGFNKLVIARRDAADLYAKRLDDRSERKRFRILYPWQMKTLPFMGSPLRIFFVPTYRSRTSLRTRAVRFLELRAENGASWASPLAAALRIK